MNSYYGHPRATVDGFPFTKDRVAYARVGQRLYALGSSPDKAIRTSVLRFLDLRAGVWTAVPHSLHNAPPRLLGHTMTYCASQLIVCGGLPDDESQTWMVYVFSLIDQTWSRHLFGRHLCFLHSHTASLCRKTWDGIGDGISDSSTCDGDSIGSHGDNGGGSDGDHYDNEVEPVLVLYGGYRRDIAGDCVQMNIYFLNLTNWSLFWVELPTVVSHTLESKQLGLSVSSSRTDAEYLTKLLVRSGHAAFVADNLLYIYGGLIDHHGSCQHTNSMVVINLCGVYVTSIIQMPNCPIPLRASPIAAQFDRGRVLVYGEFCQPGTETRAATPSSGQSTETLQTAVPNLHLGEGQVWPPLEANCTQSTKADGLASEAVYSNHTFSDRPALQPFISQQIYESQLQNDPFLHGHRVLLLSIDLSTCDWSLVCSSKQLLTTAWSYFELIPRIDDCELIECFGTKPDVSNRHPPCATASTGYSTTTAYHIRMEQLLSDGISGGHWGCMDLVFLGKLTNACFSSAPETCHYSFILPPECLDLWPAAPVPSFAGSSQLLFAAAQGELVDIWFCPDNGQAGKIGAHTVILLSRCPAYRAMMASGMAEAHTNEIVVPESAETVRAWREYLYTDMITCSLTLDSLLELLGLAHMHAFPTLRQLVVLPIIEDYLCFDTATDIIERAVLTRDNALAYVAAKLLVLYRQESLHSTPLGPCNDQVKALIDDYTSQSSCEASNQLSPQTLFASRLLQIFEQ